MTLEAVDTSSAPKAIGPYSQAIRAGDLLFCSGQIGLDPVSGELVEGGVEQQTRQALDNLAGVLSAGGLMLRQVVKTTVYLASLADFAPMNETYSGYFGDVPPARSTVEVAGLPKGAAVEIEAVAWGS